MSHFKPLHTARDRKKYIFTALLHHPFPLMSNQSLSGIPFTVQVKGINKGNYIPVQMYQICGFQTVPPCHHLFVIPPPYQHIEELPEKFSTV